jgi:hypothetical protein
MANSAPNASKNAKRETPAEELKPFQRPKAKGPRKIPIPKSLSKTETPLTNDPLWKESFVLDGEAGLVSEDAAKEFNADAAGFISLVNAEYSPAPPPPPPRCPQNSRPRPTT